MFICMPRFWLHRVMTLPTIFLRHENRGGDDGLADFLDLRQLGQLERVLDVDQGAVLHQHLVHHRRRGGDEVHVVLAFQPLLHDVHVQAGRGSRSGSRIPAPARLPARTAAPRRSACSLVSASRSASKSCDSTGYRPAKTCDCTFLKPGSGSLAGWSSSVMVSPTCADLSSLMPAMTKPTSPADNCGRSTDLGVNTPTCSVRCCAPLAMKRILSLGCKHAVDHPHQHHHADVVVEPRIDDQRLQRRVLVAARRRHLLRPPPRGFPGCRCRTWPRRAPRRSRPARRCPRSLPPPGPGRRQAGRSCSAPGSPRRRGRSRCSSWPRSALPRPARHRPPAARPRRPTGERETS